MSVLEAFEALGIVVVSFGFFNVALAVVEQHGLHSLVINFFFEGDDDASRASLLQLFCYVKPSGGPGHATVCSLEDFLGYDSGEF